MAAGKRRKILFVLGILVTGILLLIVAAPLWVPWVLRPVLARFDVRFDQYQRIGYDRLQLKDLSYNSSNITFKAESVIIHQPSVWLWRKFSNRLAREDVRVEGWSLSITPSVKSEGNTNSIPGIVRKVDEAVSQLIPWIATANLKEGKIVFPEYSLDVPQLLWNRGTATVSAEAQEPFKQGVIASAQLSTPVKRINLVVQPPVDARINLQLHPSELGSQLTGEILWQTNRATLTALFGTNTVLPQVATLTATNLVIPSEIARLEGYKDLTGAVSGTWNTNHFELSVQAEAQPANEDLSPIEALVDLRGDTNILQITTAQVSTPWLQATLSTNVLLRYSGELVSSQAILRVGIDLNKQSFVEAKGRFAGQAFLQKTESQYPRVDFDLHSEGFAGYGLRLHGIQVSGELDWPWISLHSGHVVFEDSGVAHVTARYNAVDRELLSASVKLNGPVGHEFLPPEISYTNVALTGEFKGPIENLSHSGDLDLAGLRHENGTPVRVQAEWRATSLSFEHFDTRIETDRASARAVGAAVITTNAVQVALTNLVLAHAGKTLLALKEPTSVQFNTSGSGEAWTVNLPDFTLESGPRSLRVDADVSWPEKGSVQFLAQNIDSEWIGEFVESETPAIHLERLQGRAGWTNGPLSFSANGSIRALPYETNEFTLRFDTSSTMAGMEIEQFNVLSEKGAVLTGRGKLPLKIYPGHPTNMFRLDRNAPMDFQARTVPNRHLWDEVAKLTRLQLVNPELKLALTGTIENPRGNVHAAARQVLWLGDGSRRFPSLENFEAELAVSEDLIQVRNLRLLAEGQLISAEGSLPITDPEIKSWREWLNWRRASGRIKIPQAQFAPFVKYLPELLVPQGVLDADISFKPGPQFDGFLTVTDAATRPLPNSGPLHNINAKLRFVDQQVEFEEVHALLGGQPIGFLGRIDFGTNRPGNLPLFELYLQGENVPLARRTDLVLRSDLNLRLANVTNEVPLVSGNVRLRDSFYLGDLKQLIPGRVALPSRRPPYFNLEIEPFSNWRLDVQVSGEDFLRARSPLFRGTISADLQVGGPLKEPLALGDLRIGSGSIRFPFANFQVQQGFVTLTSENPYQPQLFIQADSRAFGYDLEMTLSGPADNPVVEFTSTPSLSSEQIILMVTAGEVPRRDFGFSGQQRAQRLALFLGKSVLSRLTDGGGAERLSITTGEEISEQGRETYALEYKLSDDWSIVGEYDRFGALNVGMKWRIYSR